MLNPKAAQKFFRDLASPANITEREFGACAARVNAMRSSVLDSLSEKYESHWEASSPSRAHMWAKSVFVAAGADAVATDPDADLSDLFFELGRAVGGRHGGSTIWWLPLGDVIGYWVCSRPETVVDALAKAYFDVPMPSQAAPAVATVEVTQCDCPQAHTADCPAINMPVKGPPPSLR